jgi:hypothetical protein
MCHNKPDTHLSLAQPVVGSVPPPDDESDVTYVGATPSVCRNSLISNL